jgi:ABC-type transport system involved in multi-copper enzyme maturation permease subunit
MNRLVKVELLKLRTVRVSFGLLLTSAVLTALFAILEATQAGKSGSGVGPLDTASGLLRVTTVTGWSMMFAAVLGVIVASGEFRHASATLTYLTEPHRTRVMIAKALAALCTGSLFGLVSAIIATGVGLSFTAARGYSVTLSTEEMLGHGAGAMLGAALFAVIGVGLGSLIRSQLAGVIGVFVWGLVIESTIGGLFTSVRPYLPYTAATTLAGIKLGAAAFGPAHGVAGGEPLSFVAATALVAGVAVLIGAIAAYTSLGRDVS